MNIDAGPVLGGRTGHGFRWQEDREVIIEISYEEIAVLLDGEEALRVPCAWPMARAYHVHLEGNAKLDAPEGSSAHYNYLLIQRPFGSP